MFLEHYRWVCISIQCLNKYGELLVVCFSENRGMVEIEKQKRALMYNFLIFNYLNSVTVYLPIQTSHGC